MKHTILLLTLLGIAGCTPNGEMMRKEPPKKDSVTINTDIDDFKPETDSFGVYHTFLNVDIRNVINIPKVGSLIVYTIFFIVPNCLENVFFSVLFY